MAAVLTFIPGQSARVLIALGLFAAGAVIAAPASAAPADRLSTEPASVSLLDHGPAPRKFEPEWSDPRAILRKPRSARARHAADGDDNRGATGTVRVPIAACPPPARPSASLRSPVLAASSRPFMSRAPPLSAGKLSVSSA